MPPLLLASCSPRRVDLLRRHGIRFQAIPPGPEEGDGALAAQDEASLRARSKALGAAVPPDLDPVTPVLVLAADTLVFRGPKRFHKPGTAKEARTMLEELAGGEHDVVTAVALHRRPDGLLLEGRSVARVRLRPLAPGELDAYAAGGEWAGKAGGYALQGEAAAFVEAVDGDPEAVVGLPVAVVRALLARARGRPSTASGG